MKEKPRETYRETKQKKQAKNEKKIKENYLKVCVFAIN